jgi:hypothetical protein
LHTILAIMANKYIIILLLKFVIKLKCIAFLYCFLCQFTEEPEATEVILKRV